LLNLEKMKSVYKEKVEKVIPEDKQFELVEKNTGDHIDSSFNQKDTICEVEAALLKVAENYNNKVTLSGEKYPAYSLFRMIVDYPCQLSWSRTKGIKIERGNYEDWDWFKEANLKPNTEQIKAVVNQANNLILQQAKEVEYKIKRN